MIAGDASGLPAQSASRRRAAAAAAGAARLLAALERARPLHVVGAFVLVQWLVTLGLAVDVGHNGWIWYQGGDQVWFYTTSYLLAHGQLPLTLVGYGWSVLLMPLTLVGGPDLLQVVPAIVLLNVLVLMPVAMAAMYGIGERLGGRLVGYWVLLLWIAIPLVGIRYTGLGFHQRYTELSLPQAYGLTAMADFPSLVALAVAAYFLVRTIQRFAWPDALLAGGLASFAVGIKPSNSLFLPGAALALVLARRWRATWVVAAATAPGLLVLVFWKWRGLGYVPILHSEQATVRVALGAGGVVGLGGVDVRQYLHFDWAHVQRNLDLIREHFWSVRVFEWVVVAGVLALLRRALWVGALFGGWFLAFGLIKGSSAVGNIEDTSLLRLLIPAIPGFVLLVAALPLLVPGVARRLPEPSPPRPWGSPRTVRIALASTALLFVVVPAALAAAAHPLPDGSPRIIHRNTAPIPADSTFRLRAERTGGRVRLSWPARHAAAGKIFYTVLRGSSCAGPSLDLCDAETSLTTRGTTTVDTPPGGGRYVYVVGVSANWQDDVNGGDPYLASPPVAVTLP